MKIIFLGSGSAWTPSNENFNSNIILRKDTAEGPKNFLFDAGKTLTHALENLELYNISETDLDCIYISHLHADHCGGIEDIAFKTYFKSSPQGSDKKKLYGSFSVLNEGWENTWKGGLQPLSGKVSTLETYFDCTYMREGDKIEFWGSIILPVKTVHVEDSRRVIPSYGIYILGNTKSAFITGDSIFSPELFEMDYHRANVIFQDCDFNKYPGGVHAQFHELCTLPKETKEKMWLYHYSLGDNTFQELQNLAEDNGFLGLVERGQEFII